jgi:hypothetical protein
MKILSSTNIVARIMNLATYDVGGDKKYIFEVDTLKDKEVIEKASKHETI